MKKRDTFNKMFESGISYEEYTKSSDKYMERMKDSWFICEREITKSYQAQISRLNEKLRVLCIAESWCGDCANGVPVIAKLAEESDNWDFRIVPRDSFREEVDKFYATAGRTKIPIVIFADEDGDEIMRWVERPTRSYHLLGMLRDQNLSKEEFLEQYNALNELKPPTVSQEILRELITVADKASSIVHLNPPIKKPKILIH
ncbi:MAG: thioredoxin family protein [Candidatus Heimdallarchaeota archaeon]|nr:MAG: thioredoxin family protein [Candidatus Heimdallarchaeota archaeon]